LADINVVRDRVQVLKQLVEESLYEVDELAVAEAVMARLIVRQSMPEVSFRSEDRGPQIRSFRRERSARSPRLSGSPRLRGLHHH
jgi:hypothetical protein